ncbi:bifunctional diguanylate cyclase/phosphodiesterase [Actinoplanes bogorensis]|uniref:Bifunctional diguanylate cyclase/phosphodiesterase n=1 Tax=Paractinoplanes bogorensis TaxID=1610840 RepID=A0ABS5YWQ5_9ACTN|nr:bifunctional diguanylate cyclase/phosphodiesterase [Actinoplanes bogorensis]MBU2667871.1 bifunctional diguanylate cyclase/phosphodiesterase [Actinoplanes bogorensis]
MNDRLRPARAAWIVLPAVVLGVVLYARGGDGSAIVALLAGTTAAFLAGLSCLATSRTMPGRHRAGWLLLALAGISWGAGNTFWLWQEFFSAQTTLFPSPADYGFLIFPVAAAVGLGLLSGRSMLGSSVAPVLDGIVVAGALFLVLWSVSMRDIWAAGGESPLAYAVSLAYPIGDLVSATMALLLMTRARGRRSVVALLVAAMLGMGLADTLFAVGSADGTYVSGSWFDYGWVAGFVFLALAARRAAGRAVVVDTGTGVHRWQLLLPYLPFVVAVGVEGAGAYAGRLLDPAELFAVLLILGSLLARQLLVLLSHTSLTERLRFEASHDTLTGLANRKYFARLVDRRVASADAPVGLLHINLDHFAWVNDRLGDDVGDQLLRQAGERMAVSGQAARLSGDVFAVLVSGDLITTAEQLADAMRAPFSVGPHTVGITVSIGAAETTTSGPELRKMADLALQAAKDNGKDTISPYAPTMRTRLDREMTLRTELEAAVAQGLLQVAYQPIVKLPTAEMSGVEALARWRHPALGDVSPAEFIAVAERTGLIHELGACILEQACAEMAGLSRTGGFYVSVNVSTLQLLDPAFPARVARVLLDTGFDPARLVLEVTESVLADEAQVTTALQRLRSLGPRIAIDDFGSGYASLRYLHRFPADIVKIDRSYLEDSGAGSFIRSLIELFHSLGLTVVAEGVEEDAQSRMLSEAGSDLAQGYLFGRPMPARELAVVESRLAA